jgi:hypothetical protein
MQSVFAQPEDPFPQSPSNLTQEQRSAREQLLKQEGFSVNAIATISVDHTTSFTALTMLSGSRSARERISQELTQSQGPN